MVKAVFSFILLLAGALAVPASAHEAHSGGISVKHPWIRATSKGMGVTAGYAKITNQGKVADKLLGASLEGAGKAELHQTTIENGVAKMRPLEGGLVIEPGATVELKPAGAHLMFSDLKTTYDQDSYVDGTLVFEKAGALKLDFYVEKGAASPTSGGAGGDEHSGH